MNNTNIRITRLRIGSIIFITLFLLLVSATSSHAIKQWVFPEGTYVIPMDSSYQPDSDRGVFEAYGLVYKLLQQGVTIYWCVNEDKVDPNGVDFTIDKNSGDAPHPAYPVDVVNDTGDGAAIPSDIIEYKGGPFVINVSRYDVKQKVDLIVSQWNTDHGEDVNIHKTNRDFMAPVSRVMRGTPPKIALLDEGSNVVILQNYLVLAGLSDYMGLIYDLVTPTDIINGAIDQNPYTGEEPYNILWAPHWTGSAYYTGKTWSGSNYYDSGKYDAVAIQAEDDTVKKVSEFLDRGNALFAECASIEVFEWNPNGHFLASSGVAKNGLKNGTAITYHYNDPTSPYTQIGDWSFDLQGGHIHNWKAIPINDAIYPSGSGYNTTAIRYLYGDGTLDGGYSGPSTNGNNWDMYVAGHYKGDPSKGYVVYLAGHKYVEETIVGGVDTCVQWDKKHPTKCKKWETIGGSKEVTATNTAAVRYVLNTLLNLRYDVIPREFIRSSPITTSDNQMYLGSFEYPGFKGHFRSYDATASDASDPSAEFFDSANLIPTADNRRLFYDSYGSLLEFNTTNIHDYDITGITDSNPTEFSELTILLNSFRGKTAKQDKDGNWYYSESWKLGPIQHSTPAIVGKSTHVAGGTQRIRVAYVADGWGVLHAFYTPEDNDLTNHSLAVPTDTSNFSGTVLGKSVSNMAPGGELWAYIPGDYIPYLHDERNMVSLDVSPKVAEVLLLIDTDNDSIGDTWQYRTLLAVSRGDGGTGITVMDVTDPLNPSIYLSTSDITYTPQSGPSIKLGKTRSVSFGKVGNGETYLFLATDSQKLDQSGNQIPGITVGAINLNTSYNSYAKVEWAFSQDYLKNGGPDYMAPNDIPAGPTVIDSYGFGYVNMVFAGDSAGRLWALNTITGESIYGTDTSGKPLPVANMGEDYPIGATPTPYRNVNNHIEVLFGTGGHDWAPETNTYGIYAYDATTQSTSPSFSSGAGTELWSYPLAQGEKVYASIVKVGGYLYFGSSFGALESPDPTADIPDQTATDTGNFYALKLDGTLKAKKTNVGKVRSAAEVEGNRVYFTALKGSTDLMGTVANTQIYLTDMSDYGTNNSGAAQGSLLHLPYWHEIFTP